MSRNNKHPVTLSSGYWTSTQSYVLATITLLVGLFAGYFFRGSESPSLNGSNSVSTTGSSENLTQPVIIPGATARAVAPLLDQLRARPKDADLLNKIGNSYYDGKEYGNAIEYYEKSLSIRPDDADVRTDMATAIWYGGDADRALKEYERSLSYHPNHANTLFNMGIVKWHGKKDVNGALDAWNKLLSSNPDYPDKQRVLELIQQLRSGGV